MSEVKMFWLPVCDFMGVGARGFEGKRCPFGKNSKMICGWHQENHIKESMKLMMRQKYAEFKEHHPIEYRKDIEARNKTQRQKYAELKEQHPKEFREFLDEHSKTLRQKYAEFKERQPSEYREKLDATCKRQKLTRAELKEKHPKKI